MPGWVFCYCSSSPVQFRIRRNERQKTDRQKPVNNFTTNLCSPHHAGCEENTFTNIHVPFTICRDGARHP